MTQGDTLEIFAATAPGLEDVLRAEAAEAGFRNPAVLPGGIVMAGGWPEVWRANLVLRGANRVLARIGGFRAMHLAQLDKRARKFDWAAVMRSDVPVRVEVTCRKSRIYHAGAAAQRIERALREELGASVAEDAPVRLMARIEDDLCTFSIDTSGEALHRRGHKEAVGKAPMRETLAALFLRQCGFDGTEPLLDPMCGSGTHVIEAAEIAAGLAPGRSRAFSFERLATFDPDAWQAMLSRQAEARRSVPAGVLFRGFDRDSGAIRMSRANAARAGVEDLSEFVVQPVSALQRPDGPTGLVLVNPPYGARIGNRKLLFALYAALGKRLLEDFSGWRVGVITTDGGLARATGLPFAPAGPPIPHGGLKVRLYRTGPLR